jgi:hypothetical protein
MTEKEWPQIEIIGDTPSRRDCCKVAPDDEIRSALLCLLILESQLSQDSLPEWQRKGAVIAHTIIWSHLPFYYKLELADLTTITQ